MKTKLGKFLRNPAPFALTVVNPAKKHKKRRRKNPSQLDLFDAGSAPAAKTKAKAAPRAASISPRPAGAIGRSAKQWHHKRGGPYVYNPAHKTGAKKRRRKNPLTCKHVIVKTPAKNPAGSMTANGIPIGEFMGVRTYFLRGSYSAPSLKIWGYSSERKLHSAIKRKLSSATKNPTMKKRKRSRKSSRNPVAHISRGRSRRSHRNPSRRRGKTRFMRNPVAIVSDVFSAENMAVGAGVLTGVVGTRYIVNTLLQGDATGKRMFDLPGITYPTATAPMTAAQFSEKNKVALAIYEAALPGVVGYLLRNQAPRFSRGVILSALVNLGTALLKTTTIGQKAGLSAFLPRGAATYIPGVPPQLSGPATAFINNGSPVATRARAGAGAVVNRDWSARTVSAGGSPFTS